MGNTPLKVMVVDDSAFMRKFLGEIIQQDSALQLVGTARHGLDALAKLESLKPDVLTLDVEMPVLNGLDTLKKIMAEKPLPVVMVSSFTQKGSKMTIEALAAGAVDFIPKPSSGKGEHADEIKRLLPRKIKEAAKARLHAIPFPGAPRVAKKAGETFFPEEKQLEEKRSSASRAVNRIIAIGASTGGPRALEEVLRGLPADLPAAVFITQHMPPHFTRSLAERLDKTSLVKVKEASAGESIRNGEAYVAPGGYHLLAQKDGTVFLSNAVSVNHVRPSADVMMESVAEVFGAAAIGVVLTGMGRDGAAGMVRIKEKGGQTIVQDPSSAVLPGMPRAVLQRGSADLVLSLNQIAAAIVQILNKER